MPKIIGVRFPDNDFGNTICAFLRSLSFHGLDAYDFDKEKFVKLYNATIYSFYLIGQRLGQESAQAQNYLQITTDNVYFDNEVREHLIELGGGDNSEFHVIDCQNPNSEPYIYTA